ncbi:oligosaccharide flippase family protein [Paenibacillus sp. JMULE4]|uniref:oligosaccharide flippase family protein n=1 Tax=Paenibacillus sp. JMULE4 TaxID=2518342 RepID=UPI002814FF08|nr:oligosaccharide flippase family protein [Paenibacillus sp. JMULE4]
MLATNLLLAVFQSLDKFKIYNLIRFSVPTFNIIGLVLLWQLGKLTVYSAILNNFLVSFLVTVWAIYLMIREIKDKWEWEWNNSLLVPFTRYGLRVFILELLGVLSGQLDKIIIITLLTPREFGLYSVAFTLSRVFNVLQTAVSNVIFPKVTGLDQSDIVTKVSRGFRISMIIMGMIIIPFILLGPFLIQLFLGKDFISSSFIFYLLSWECVIGGGSWILAQAFNALGRPGLIVIRQAIALIVTVGLFFILAPIWGLIGISIALLTGAMIRLAITLVSFPIVLKIPLKQVIYNKDDYRYLKSVLNLKRRGLV